MPHFSIAAEKLFWMIQNRKTLIILIPGFPKDEQDSTCVPFPQSFVKNLKQLYPWLKITVLAFQYPFSKGVYDWHGVEVHSFNGGNRGKIKRLFLWKSVWAAISGIMEKETVIGLLNFWLGECSLVGKFAANKRKLKSFTWIMGQDAKRGNRYIPIIKPRSDSLIALSDFISEEFHRNYQMRPEYTIPPGLDTRLFPELTGDRDIDILGAGSLIPLKQYDLFIELISRLVTSMPDIRAVLCGDGPDRSKLEQIIRENNLKDRVSLTGELEHSKVLGLMQRSKIFLHPSSYEGFGMVCAEALYAGAKVVSFCKPMNSGFAHQYVVTSASEMERKVKELLEFYNNTPDRVLTFPIEECCRQVFSLYS
jgi:glycosyltransferase involved in cell wall biosynthesis